MKRLFALILVVIMIAAIPASAAAYTAPSSPRQYGLPGSSYWLYRFVPANMIESELEQADSEEFEESYKAITDNDKSLGEIIDGFEGSDEWVLLAVSFLDFNEKYWEPGDSIKVQGEFVGLREGESVRVCLWNDGKWEALDCEPEVFKDDWIRFTAGDEGMYAIFVKKQ